MQIIGTNELNCNKKFRTQGESDVCPFCPIIEDEAHFLLECHMYRNLRYKYISRHWISLNNIEWKELVANDNLEIVKDTALYIQKALKIREDNL